MNQEVTVNHEQKLYVIPAQGGGYSCLGFEVAYAKAQAVWEWLDDARICDPDAGWIGTPEGYADYQRLMALGAEHACVNHTWLYDWGQDTPQAVKAALLDAKDTGARVRIFYGDPVTGRDWGQEHDVTGTVSRSTGWFKCLILVANSRSDGGPAILTGNTVRLYVGGQEVYRHPQYHQPTYTFGAVPASKWSAGQDGYTHGVYADGENVANFKTYAAAHRWIAFMTGKRMAK
jgi:hypothetical protein